LGRDVAVKILPSDLSSDPELKACFKKLLLRATRMLSEQSSVPGGVFQSIQARDFPVFNEVASLVA
jgi:hypothetical protein